MIRLVGIALAAVAVSGCSLFLTDEDNFDDCLDDGRLEAIVYERNPFSGQCVERASGPGNPCDLPTPAEAPEPGTMWGLCYEACDAFFPDDEIGCLNQPGCRAAYTDGVVLLYQGCWPVSVGPGDTNAICAALGAFECSLSDQCSAVHDPAGCQDEPCSDLEVGGFVYCISEPLATPAALP